MGWNVDCVQFLLVFHVRRLSPGRVEKNGKSAPSSTRMWGIWPNKRNFCSRFIVLQLRSVPWGTLRSCKTNVVFYVFGEVSNEVLCWLGVKRKGRKSGPAATTDSSMWPTNSNPLSVAGSVLQGSRCGNPRWRQFLSFPAMWFPAMAAGVASQESNAACNCFGANRKKTKWPHVDDIINNMAHKL